MELKPEIKTLIGFAAKSRKLLLGTYSVEEGIRRGTAKLVLVATDTNPKRLEILTHWCKDKEIPLLSIGTKEEYGLLLHKKPVGLLGIAEPSLAEGIRKAAKKNGGD